MNRNKFKPIFCLRSDKNFIEPESSTFLAMQRFQINTVITKINSIIKTCVNKFRKKKATPVVYTATLIVGAHYWKYLSCLDFNESQLLKLLCKHWTGFKHAY